MSSANRVRLTYIKEAEGVGYGITPTTSDATNPWKELRKTSESLSGTPTTTESAEARTDRQSAGTITTGLEVQGGVEYEIAGSDCFKDMYIAGMKYDDTDPTHGWAGTKGAWAVAIEGAVDTALSITYYPRTVTDPSYVKMTGSFAEIADAAVPTSSGRNRVKGHIVQLVNPFNTLPAVQLNTKNKKAIYIPRTPYTVVGGAGAGDVVGTVTSGSIIGFAKDMFTETGRTALVSVPEMASIGVLDISYTIEKRFTDLTGPAQPGGPSYVKTIVYRGSLVDTMSINFAYGEIATGAFNYVANDHETPIDPIAPDAPGTSAAGPAVAATGTAINGVVFTATSAGFAGNVAIPFTAGQLPSVVVPAWNSAHPANQQVSFDVDTAFVGAETVQLQGGKDINAGETLLPVESEIALNASVDVGLVIVDDIPTTYCIQSLSLELNNNSQAQNCIGSIAPEKYTQGSAALTADMTAYLEDSNWLYIEKKIKSTPIQIVYYAVNQDGGIGVNIPELQLSFDDPAATGKDEIVELTISGSARYSSKPELQNSFFMYWLRPADMKEALP